jgi:methanol dehydrogenase (cytochrome c) subunit 2
MTTQMTMQKKLTGVMLMASAALLLSAATASAYDGLHCKEPGVCWQPKPGYPAVVKGSKYDPKLDPKEVAKQGDSERAMEERNAKRTEHFKKTGVWIYDVSKL